MVHSVKIGFSNPLPLLIFLLVTFFVLRCASEYFTTSLPDFENSSSGHSAYIPPPTVEELVQALSSLEDGIHAFTSKGDAGDWWIKKHRCISRPAWGLMYKKREILHFEWDHQHGDLEVYKPKRGPHLGSISFTSDPGSPKPAVPGRVRSCQCN